MNQKSPETVRPSVLVLAAVGLVLVAFLLMPQLAVSHKSEISRIVSNLRQIDVAKQNWSADHSITGSLQISVQDLAPYMGKPRGSSNLVTPVIEERYLINPLGLAPEAQLTRRVSRLPSGTVVRLQAVGSPGFQIILPNQITGGNSRRAIQFEHD